MAKIAAAKGNAETAAELNKLADDKVESSGWITKTLDGWGWISGEPTFNAIKDKYDLTGSGKPPTTTTNNTPTEDTSKSAEELEKEKQDNEDRRQRKREIEIATRASVAQATTDDVSQAAQKKGGGAATISTGEMIKADDQTGFESRFYQNKGGLLQKPKRKSKKPRGKGLGSK